MRVEGFARAPPSSEWGNAAHVEAHQSTEIWTSPYVFRAGDSIRWTGSRMEQEVANIVYQHLPAVEKKIEKIWLTGIEIVCVTVGRRPTVEGYIWETLLVREA